MNLCSQLVKSSPFGINYPCRFNIGTNWSTLYVLSCREAILRLAEQSGNTSMGKRKKVGL